MQEKNSTFQPTICTGNHKRSMGVLCSHMIRDCLLNGGQVQLFDFHPHSHWFRPRPGAERIILPPPVLDPESMSRQDEATRCSQARQHDRARRAQTDQILSQHENTLPVLRHCSGCIEYGHDHHTCTRCCATNHTRNACPHISYQRRTASSASNIFTQLSQIPQLLQMIETQSTRIYTQIGLIHQSQSTYAASVPMYSQFTPFQPLPSNQQHYHQDQFCY